MFSKRIEQFHAENWLGRGIWGLERGLFSLGLCHRRLALLVKTKLSSRSLSRDEQSLPQTSDLIKIMPIAANIS